ncbi:MAG: response regulator [Chitinivibrionales bacterium]|nr:response regulator [Chitinivibrionales bacterium]
MPPGRRVCGDDTDARPPTRCTERGSGGMSATRIAIVDDHDLFRDGLRLVLEQVEQFTVILSASSGQRFLQALREIRTPDVVLMDICMPAMDGVETTIEALRLRPSLRIIALTMYSDLLHFNGIVQAGARGFVLKNASKNELRNAILEVCAGREYFSESIAGRLALQSERAGAEPLLTRREFEILELICRGWTTQHIADVLSISGKTVEVHRSNIFRKTQVRNVAQLIIWAVRHRLVSVEQQQTL